MVLERELKRIRLKIEEGQEEEALATLDALGTASSQQEELDIVFTRAWYFAHKEQWSEVIALLAPHCNADEIEENWHAASLKERERRAIYLLWLGNAAVNHSYYDDAAHYFARCLRILEMRRVHLPRVQIQALLGYAMTCIPLGLQSLAVQYYEKALQLCAKEKLFDNLPDIYYGLADAYRQVGKFGDAYRYGKMALEIYRERGNRPLECRMLNLLGRVALQTGDYRAAADYYMDSLAIATADQYTSMQLINFVAIADLRLDEGRLEDATRYCDDAEEICFAIKDDHHVCGMMYMIHGKVLQREAEQCQQGGQSLLKKALTYFERAREHFIRTQALTHLKEIHGRIAGVYEALGQPGEALIHWKSAANAVAGDRSEVPGE
jgi:tetratricopeptide (TPR) repeat protein